MQNFGKIKNTFNNILVESIADKTNDNKDIFKEFIKTIKENKVLKTQFNVYYDIEHKSEDNILKSSEFVKECISLMNSYSKKEIINANKKLMSILESKNIGLYDGDYECKELHENIANLIFTKKTSKTIDTIVESLDKVITHVQTNGVKENSKPITEDIVPNSLIGNMMIDIYNTKYADLNESEKVVIKRISETNSSGRKEILKDLSNECLTLVNNKIKESTDLSEKEALLNVKEVLLTLEYSENTFEANIGRIMDLKKALDD